MGPMVRASLRVVAIALAATLAVVPLVLDGCLIACHATRQADSKATQQSCHHASASSGIRLLTGSQTACGHDHDQTALVAAAGDGSRSSAFMHLPVAFTATVSISGVLAVGFASPPPRSGPHSTLSTSRILPLRI